MASCATSFFGLVETPNTSSYLHGTEPTEQARLSLLNDLLNKATVREMRLRGGERILDLGCGLGQLSRALAEAADTKIIAVERSAEQIAEAERLAAEAGESAFVTFRQGDATKELPLREKEWGNFEVVHTRFLLEHVPDPLSVVKTMVRAARPGGRIVLADDDHDLLRLWPEPPEFPDLWEAYQRSYEHLGNDPNIGRRLFSLLAEAGAKPMRNSFIFFGSCAGERHFAAYVENLIGVIETARETIIQAGLLEAKRFDAAIAALREWSKNPVATIWYAVCWAEGRKPNK